MSSGAIVVSSIKGTELVDLHGTGGPIWAQASTGLIRGTQPVTASLTASTTHTIAGGTALILGMNVVGTVANASDAVTLPVMQPGQSLLVINNGANALAVYPGNSSQNIDAAGAGTAVTLTNPKKAMFYCTAANTIFSAVLGAAAT